MDYFIECPICEQQFHCSADSPSNKVTCPGCSRRFELSAAIKLDATAPKPASAPATPQKKRLAVPPTATVSSNDSKELGLEPLDDSSQNVPPAKVIKAPGPKPLTANRLIKKRRNKRKAIWTIATVVLLAAVIGVLAGLLVMQLQKKPLSKKSDAGSSDQTETKLVNDPDSQELEAKRAESDSSDSDKADPVDPDSKLAKGNNRKSAPKVNSPKEKRIRIADLEPLKYVFHSEKDVVDCWELVQPHLVSLTVHDARGEHQAVGTIVDSRGWIVTSYSAVKGASKIEVTSSVKSIEDLPNPDLLEDSVRGVIKLAPEQDLALLSINRRFVVSFADIQVTKKYHVVEAEYLIQSTPPSKLSPYARQESQIKICGKLDSLADAAQQLAKARDLVAPELNWIVCPDKQDTLPGSPLIRIDGTFEAINVFSENGMAHYVPVDRLRGLIADAKDQPEPLSVLGGADMDDGLVSLATSHPIRKASVEMNKLAEVCDKFDWIPKNKGDFDQLQKFSEQFAIAVEYVKTNRESDPELTSEAQTQIERIQNSISKGLQSKVDYPAMKQANEFAGDELKKGNRVVPFFGKVYELEVSAGSDFLELNQTDNFVALTKDQNRPHFSREDECLAFVKTPPNPRTITFSVGDEKIPATVVDLVTRIDSLQ